MIRQNFTISVLTKKQLRELKNKMGISESDIVRRAVEIYWKNNQNENIKH